MTWRFRRSIKVAPGVRLNISKSGISTSLGVPGATVNFGRRGARATAGIPGTGLSFSQQISTPPATGPRGTRHSAWWVALVVVIGLAAMAKMGGFA
jgi:hypothetical protein